MYFISKGKFSVTIRTLNINLHPDRIDKSTVTESIH